MAEEIFEVESKESVRITGVTIIDHRIRRKLGVSCDEYVILDFIARWRRAKPNAEITSKALETKTGFAYTDELGDILDKLHSKKLVQKATNSNMLDVSDKWKQHFASDTDFDNPDEKDPGFWQLYGKVGNKKNAMSKYFEVRKKISKEELHSKAKIYVDYCHKSGTYMKHAETWLAPDKEHWNDILDPSRLPEQPATQSGVMKGDFYGKKQ